MSEDRRIRGEFHRLSEAAAGSLINQTPYLELQKVIGSPRVLPNAVQAETKHLFDKFATKETNTQRRREPYTRPIERFGDVVALPILGELHHRYARTMSRQRFETQIDRSAPPLAPVAVWT